MSPWEIIQHADSSDWARGLGLGAAGWVFLGGLNGFIRRGSTSADNANNESAPTLG